MLFAYHDQPSTDASADQICLIIPARSLSDQWLIIRNLGGINQSPPSDDHHRISERRKHSDTNLSFSRKNGRKKEAEFCACHQRESRVVIGEGWDLVAAASDKRVNLHKISVRRDPNFASAPFESGLKIGARTRDPGFYNQESANKHQLLVISLNDTPARVL